MVAPSTPQTFDIGDDDVDADDTLPYEDAEDPDATLPYDDAVTAPNPPTTDADDTLEYSDDPQAGFCH